MQALAAAAIDRAWNGPCLRISTRTEGAMQMSRQVIDGVLIAALLALAATHLYGQTSGSRKVIRPVQVVAKSAPQSAQRFAEGCAGVASPSVSLCGPLR
jgi:hypothetical protein